MDTSSNSNSSNNANGPNIPWKDDAAVPQLDLDAYIANYTGHTKTTRLRFIADKCISSYLKLEATRMLLDEILKGENTQVYVEVMSKLDPETQAKLGPKYAYSQEWVNSTEKRAAQQQEKLEQDLNGYKTGLIKESIRMGYNDLGDFYYRRGELQQAFKCYVRTRDYCNASKHVIAMCLHVIRVGVNLGHFVHVQNYVQKAELTPDITDGVLLGRLRCALGLAHLEGKKYKLAARKFVDIPIEFIAPQGSNYSEVIAPQDVAVYGGLCALATFERSDLKSKVIDNTAFMSYLELAPEVRELIMDFHSSRYAKCLKHLASLKPALDLDIHLYDHVGTLFQLIRSKALIQYTAPFTSVHLPTMAAALRTDVDSLEAELAQLIMASDISARIDSHNKVLYARHANERSATFSKALSMGEAFERDCAAFLLQASYTRSECLANAERGHRGGEGRDGGDGSVLPYGEGRMGIGRMGAGGMRWHRMYT